MAGCDGWGVELWAGQAWVFMGGKRLAVAKPGLTTLPLPDGDT